MKMGARFQSQSQDGSRMFGLQQEQYEHRKWHDNVASRRNQQRKGGETGRHCFEVPTSRYDGNQRKWETLRDINQQA